MSNLLYLKIKDLENLDEIKNINEKFENLKFCKNIKIKLNNLYFYNNNEIFLCDKKDLICSICYKEMNLNELHKIKCNHIFCKKCFELWNKECTNNYNYLNCPLCRLKIN